MKGNILHNRKLYFYSQNLSSIIDKNIKIIIIFLLLLFGNEFDKWYTENFMSPLLKEILEHIENRARDQANRDSDKIHGSVISSLQVKVTELEKYNASLRGQIDAGDSAAERLQRINQELGDTARDLRATIMATNCKNTEYIKTIKAIRDTLKIPEGWLNDEIVEFINTRMKISHNRQPKKGK